MPRSVSMLLTRLPRVSFAMSPLASLSRVSAAAMSPPAGYVHHQVRWQSAAAAAMPSAPASPSASAPRAAAPSSSSPPRISKTIRRTADVKVAPTVVLPPPPAAGGGKSSSCSTEQPVEVRPLSALERRQRAHKDKPIFVLGPSAVYRITQLLQSAPKHASTGESAIGLRVGVTKRGCSGYSFTMNYFYACDLKPNDVRINDPSGIAVVIAQDLLFYVIGTRMDYTISNVEEKFVFENPKTQAKCGCGDSFMPAMDD